MWWPDEAPEVRAGGVRARDGARVLTEPVTLTGFLLRSLQLQMQRTSQRTGIWMFHFSCTLWQVRERMWGTGGVDGSFYGSIWQSHGVPSYVVRYSGCFGEDFFPRDEINIPISGLWGKRIILHNVGELHPISWRSRCKKDWGGPLAKGILPTDSLCPQTAAVGVSSLSTHPADFWTRQMS